VHSFINNFFHQISKDLKQSLQTPQMNGPCKKEHQEEQLQMSKNLY